MTPGRESAPSGHADLARGPGARGVPAGGTGVSPSHSDAELLTWGGRELGVPRGFAVHVRPGTVSAGGRRCSRTARSASRVGGWAGGRGAESQAQSHAALFYVRLSPNAQLETCFKARVSRKPAGALARGGRREGRGGGRVSRGAAQPAGCTALPALGALFPAARCISRRSPATAPQPDCPGRREALVSRERERVCVCACLRLHLRAPGPAALRAPRTGCRRPSPCGHQLHTC